MTMTDLEKAAFVAGMVRAFKTTRWPKHFNKDDKAQWLQRERIAHQMLTGGAFNPLDHWSVTQLYDQIARTVK